MNLNIGDILSVKTDCTFLTEQSLNRYKSGDKFMLIGFNMGKDFIEPLNFSIHYKFMNKIKLNSLYTNQIIYLTNHELNSNFETLIEKRNSKIDSILWK